MKKDALWKLQGCVKHYAWGGKQFIPELICLANEEEEPFAELWYGQHPACPSVTSDGTTLRDLISSSPETFFTPKERKRWKNELPFLCKILDVEDMLSIQIHPDKKQAVKGFQEEENDNIPGDAPERTFRDRNHKPEMMYALSEFYLLHDFREEEEIQANLERFSSLKVLSEKFRTKGLESFYRDFMKQSQDHINKDLGPFAREIKGMEIPEDPMIPEYWIKRAIDQFCTPRKVDRGILSFYLMNLVHLMPGEVVYQGSGILHAYLRGQNIEIMANSDNVIRGGLTSKYIDAEALGKLVRFDQRTIHYIQPEEANPSQKNFRSPVEEFQLSVIELEPFNEFPVKTVRVSLLFSTCNCLVVHSDTQQIRIERGEALLVRAGESLVFQSRKPAKLFLVTTQG